MRLEGALATISPKSSKVALGPATMKILGYFRAANSSQIFAQVNPGLPSELTLLVSDRARRFDGILSHAM